MDTGNSAELLADLLRSAFVVEAARAQVYTSWAGADPTFTRRAELAVRRTELARNRLLEAGRRPDEALVAGHVAWIESLTGKVPGEVAFADILLVRLGDWVARHAAVFYGEAAAELDELAEAERAELKLPESLPVPPPFERLQAPEPQLPGEVLFRFAVLGDLHIGSAVGDDLAAAAIADINASGAELVVQLGDITDHGEAAEFDAAVALLTRLEAPCYTMLGNHDVFSVSEGRLAGRDRFAAAFGRAPDGVLVEHRGFRFCVLDSAEHDTSPFPPFDLLTGTFMDGPGGAVVRGSLTPPQHDLLAEVAAPGAPPAFVFLHHPVQPYTGFPPVLFGLRDADSGRLHAVVDSGNVWGIFAGHTHRNARTRTFSGVPAHEVAIPRDFPCGFALVDVCEHGYAYRFVQVSDDDLLRAAYGRAGEIWRRYAGGAAHERAFSWSAPRR